MLLNEWLLVFIWKLYYLIYMKLVIYMKELNLDDYRCECGGIFKPFGKKNMKQYICTECGHFVIEEKMYMYKKEYI